VLGKTGSSPNSVLAILLSDGIQLEVEIPEQRQLLVEEIILPGPRTRLLRPTLPGADDSADASPLEIE